MISAVLRQEIGDALRSQNVEWLKTLLDEAEGASSISSVTDPLLAEAKHLYYSLLRHRQRAIHELQLSNSSSTTSMMMDRVTSHRSVGARGGGERSRSDVLAAWGLARDTSTSSARKQSPSHGGSPHPVESSQPVISSSARRRLAPMFDDGSSRMIHDSSNDNDATPIHQLTRDSLHSLIHLSPKQLQIQLRHIVAVEEDARACIVELYRAAMREAIRWAVDDVAERRGISLRAQRRTLEERESVERRVSSQAAMQFISDEFREFFAALSVMQRRREIAALEESARDALQRQEKLIRGKLSDDLLWRVGWVAINTERSTELQKQCELIETLQSRLNRL